MAKKLVKYVVVDAFTDTAFKGNPAAVCVLEEEKDDKWLQSVAAEFNVSQTAYLTSLNEVNEPTKTNPRFGLRWFTPVNEVDLCGHATLGAAHFLFANGLVKTDIVEFSTRSGILTAKRVPEAKASNSQDDEPTGYSIELDFPVLQVGTTNFTDIPTISKSLNGASAVEINETSKGDLFNQSSLSLNWLSARTFGALSWDSPDTITKPTTCIHDCLDVVQAAFGYPKNQCQGLRKFYVKSQIQQLSTEK